VTPTLIRRLLVLAAVLVMVPSVSLAAPPQQVLGGFRSDTTYGCLVCHAENRRAFFMGVHSERGIRCHDCHGGNPRAFETGPAHAGPFIGDPDKFETVELCSTCHSDPNRMRQHGVRVDQLAEFRSSRHGDLLLLRRNTEAPTCTDCHDAHLILPPEDARSNVHPTNIPTTCAACHNDEALMAKYGIPTDQFAEYRASAHGVGVFEKENFAAPTCIGCHGSHAALPPGVAEIVNVCDRCHVLVGRAFEAGPHGSASRGGRLPGCLACHSNHGTERVPPDSIVALCERCHEPGSRPLLVGAELQAGVVRAARDLVIAERAVGELRLSGYQVADERFRYQTALTSFRQMEEVQHNLDMVQLEELARRVRSNTEIIRATAEARAEERWEHKLLLVPVWFLALSALTFAWFKLRDVRVAGGMG
jgi:hypothetical protein